MAIASLFRHKNYRFCAYSAPISDLTQCCEIYGQIATNVEQNGVLWVTHSHGELLLTIRCLRSQGPHLIEGPQAVVHPELVFHVNDITGRNVLSRRQLEWMPADRQG